MGSIVVVQAGIVSLDAVQTAVEGGRLDADLWNQVAGKLGLEVGRCQDWEEVSEEERGHRRLPAHDGCRVILKSRVEACGRRGTARQESGTRVGFGHQLRNLHPLSVSISICFGWATKMSRCFECAVLSIVMMGQAYGDIRLRLMLHKLELC